MLKSTQKWLTSHWPLLCILFITLVVYGPALSTAGFTTWDDGHLVYENTLVQHISLNSLKTIFTSYDPELYIPITILSYQLDFILGGLNATVFHVHNLLLHLLNITLVYLCIVKIFQKKWMAIIGAALFALHPVETETVMWISARKDLLATAYSLGTLLLFYEYIIRKNYWFFLGSIALFIIGLMCKVSILGLPFLLVALYFYQKKQITIRVLKDMFPFFALSIIFGWIALIGKQEIIIDLPRLALPIMSVESFTFGLQKIFLPLHLSPIYLIHTPITLSMSAVLSILLLGATLYALYRKKIHIGAIMGLAWYFIFLAPTFPAFTRGGEVYITSDHYLYTPSIGIFIGLLLIVDVYVRRKKITLSHVYIGACIILVPCIVLSFLQSWIWQSSETLYAHALAKDPTSHIAANNLGLVLWQEQKKAQEGEMLFRHAAELKNDYAMPYRNLGMLYTEFGVLDQAIKEFTLSLDRKPNQADVHFAMGTIYMQQQKFGKAAAAFETAIQLEEKIAESYVNLGIIANANQNLIQEQQMYQLAIQSDPTFMPAYYNLALSLLEIGDKDKAIEILLQAIEIDATYTPIIQKLEELNGI